MKSLMSLMHSIEKKIVEKSSLEKRVRYLRRQGVKIGENCNINTMEFSTEPYLIELGNHVAIAYGTNFITHDGAMWCFEGEIDGAIFGKIVIGNNVFIGPNCTILQNTTIGENSIVGAGSVVRGHFPANSVIVGNPAKVVLSMKAQKMLYKINPGLVNGGSATESQAEKIIKSHFGITP
jgi:acetyltransferase-like isoleucine patch superfamily enzyme